MSNPIIDENALTGTTAWRFSSTATTEIQVYADKTSYNPNDIVTFFVSVQVGGTTWTAKIFRLGWYGGLGGRQVGSIGTQTGVAQGYWNASTSTLVNCPTAIIDTNTHLLEAGWASSVTWTVPANAVTGVYLAQFTDQNGKQWACCFVVRGNSPADYAIVRSFTTDQAYNDWGGYSLYTNPTVGTKVSFNRPITRGGTAGVFAYELPFLHWSEQQGYNLSYLSGIDVHASPSVLLNYKAVLVSGHNEYWTWEMRGALESALAAKIGLGFLGANAVFWQTRLENDAAGNPNRTLVCYKVLTSSSNLSLDPQYGVNNSRVTSQWRDPVLNRPENALIGIMFWDDTHAGNSPWEVDAGANSPYLAGTGLVPGQTYGTDLVGYEWDNVQSGGPSNLNIIGTSNMTGTAHGASVSNSTTYVAPSGALVFASGSVSWTWALDTFRPTGSTPVVPQMQVLMANIMGALKGLVFSSFAMHQ